MYYSDHHLDYKRSVVRTLFKQAESALNHQQNGNGNGMENVHTVWELTDTLNECLEFLKRNQAANSFKKGT